MKATLSASPPPVRYSEDVPSAPGYYVYRLWAEDGRCLYVGRTGNNGPRPPQVRLNWHRRTKPWWSEVARIDVASLPDHSAIIAEEAAQIAALRPPHNTQRGNCTHDLSLPGAIRPSSGNCSKCAAASAKGRQRKPEDQAKRRARDQFRLSGGARRVIAKRRPSPGQLPLGGF